RGRIRHRRVGRIGVLGECRGAERQGAEHGQSEAACVCHRSSPVRAVTSVPAWLNPPCRAACRRTLTTRLYPNTETSPVKRRGRRPGTPEGAGVGGAAPVDGELHAHVPPFQSRPATR